MMHHHEVHILELVDDDFDIQMAMCMVRNASILGETTASAMDITHYFITHPTDVRITCKMRGRESNKGEEMGTALTMLAQILTRVKDRLQTGLRNSRFVQMSKAVGERHRHWGVTAAFVLQAPALRRFCGLTETMFRAEECVEGPPLDDEKSPPRCKQEERAEDADRRKDVVDIPVLAAQDRHVNSTSDAVEHASVYDDGEWINSICVFGSPVGVNSNLQTCVPTTCELVDTFVTENGVSTTADRKQEGLLGVPGCSLLNEVNVRAHDSAFDSTDFLEATDSDSNDGSERFSIRRMKRSTSQGSVGSTSTSSSASTDSWGLNTRWIPQVKRSSSLESIESRTSTGIDSALSSSDDESSENVDSEEQSVQGWNAAETGYKLCGVNDRQQNLLDVIRWTSFEDLLEVLRIHDQEEINSSARESGLCFPQQEPFDVSVVEQPLQVTAAFKDELEKCSIGKKYDTFCEEEGYDAEEGEPGLRGNRQEDGTVNIQHSFLSTSADDDLDVERMKNLHEYVEEEGHASTDIHLLRAVQPEGLKITDTDEQAFSAAVSISAEDDVQNDDQHCVIGTYSEEEEYGEAVGPDLCVTRAENSQISQAAEQACLTTTLNSVRDNLKTKNNLNMIEQAFLIAMSASFEEDDENLDATFNTLDMGADSPTCSEFRGGIQTGQLFGAQCRSGINKDANSDCELSNPEEEKRDLPSNSDDDILNNNLTNTAPKHDQIECQEHACDSVVSVDNEPTEGDQSSLVQLLKDAPDHRAFCSVSDTGSEAGTSTPASSPPPSPARSESSVTFNERSCVGMCYNSDCSVDSLAEDFKIPAFSKQRWQSLPTAYASPKSKLPGSDRLDCVVVSSRSSSEDSNSDSTQWPFPGAFTAPLSKAIIDESAEASRWLEEHSVDSSSYSPTISRGLGSSHHYSRLHMPRRSLFSFSEYSEQTRMEMTFGRQAESCSFAHQEEEEEDSLQYGDNVLMSSTPATLVALRVRKDLASDSVTERRKSVIELNESEISFGFTERR